MMAYSNNFRSVLLFLLFTVSNTLRAGQAYGIDKRYFYPVGMGGGGQIDLSSLFNNFGRVGNGRSNSFNSRPNQFQPFSGSQGNQLGTPERGSNVDGSGEDYHQAALEETNKYRAMHGAPPLELDPKLSQDCQIWAEKLAKTNSMQHSSANDYGENLWMMGGQILDPAASARKAVKDWYDEVNMYDWNNPTFSGSTGHFTALVWKSTTKMGIGLATNKASRSTYVVARYTPPGNMMGDFERNVGRRQ